MKRAVGPLDKRKRVTRCQACAKRQIKVRSLMQTVDQFNSIVNNSVINSAKAAFHVNTANVPKRYALHRLYPQLLLQQRLMSSLSNTRHHSNRY